MFIDAHRHYSYEKSDMEKLPQILDEANITKTVLFGFNGYGKPGQDDDVLSAYKKYPSRVIPFACDFDFSADPAGYAEKCLSSGFCGLGEFLIGSWTQARYFAGLSYLDKRVIETFHVAGEHNAPVLFRCDKYRYEEIMDMLRMCRKTNFIWAHAACDYAKKQKTSIIEPEFLRYMLIMHPNIYFDLSVPLKLLPGFLTYKYTEIFRDYPEHFVFGTDITGMYRTSQEAVMPAYQDFCLKLPSEIRDGIMYENILRLLPGGKTI
ncbi:MAG: amidohydrolase family protein [Firmicutes bacterium]|nr:amidohydrolase family protein [Bacillota bacterium]